MISDINWAPIRPLILCPVNPASSPVPERFANALMSLTKSHLPVVGTPINDCAKRMFSIGDLLVTGHMLLSSGIGSGVMGSFGAAE